MSQQNSKSASLASNVGGCLVILMVMGVLASVAVPSFQVKLRNNKQWEPRDYISLINKRQQAYFAVKSVFSTSVKALGIRIIKSETENYKYSHHTTKEATFNYGVSKHKDLKSFVGGVFVIPVTKFDSNASKTPITTTSIIGGAFVIPAIKVDSNSSKNNIAITSILCGADSPGTIKPAEPTYQNGGIVCGKGTTQVRQQSN
ncbi:type IV pilin-like G/H family protein [Microcoleus sp. B3-A4]|uniref:type IV pilin-like G/H family protein n=1 Tax=Microcoleus sp. B3-A4 TaxID=2818653 RepID=UPI002FD2DC82